MTITAAAETLYGAIKTAIIVGGFVMIVAIVAGSVLWSERQNRKHKR